MSNDNLVRESYLVRDSVASLKKFPRPSHGQLALTMDSGLFYRFDGDSDSTGNDGDVVKPNLKDNDENGRWLLCDYKVISGFAGVKSFQPVGADLGLDGAAGSDDGTNPKFLAAMMGNLLADEEVVGEGNYLAGIIGAYSVPTHGSDYPTGGVIGVIMDDSEGADGCVVAVIDGSDPSGVTRARAAFAARILNNNAGSGVDFGLDLTDAGSAHYSGGGVALACAKADIRMTSKVCIKVGAGAPTNGVTGANETEKGSLYIDKTNGILYINTNTLASPTWTKVGTQS